MSSAPMVGTFQLSDAINRISVSPTMAVLMAAEKLRASGVDVADFGPGEPDFPTPEHIKRAAIRAIEENKTKYTPTAGIAPLRQAVCDWHAKYLGSSYEPKECVFTSGGKLAIFNVVCSLINAGDEVVVPAPYWVTYPDIVKFAGGKPVIVQTSASDNFRLRARELEKALTPRTRIVIVNSPNNPTGAVIPQDEFARILEICRKHGVWLLSDECYSHFTYGSAKPFSIASLPGAKEHVIIAGSLSKTFAMTGWRAGYTLAPEPLSSAMIKLQSQSVSNVTSITQHAALEALRGPLDSAVVMLAEYARRRTHILAGLRAIPGIECTEPEGAFYVFPKVSARGGGVADSTVVTRELLEKQHVAVVPGDAFGAPGHLRISYATSMERIDEGLRRLTQYFSAA
ncbi:MAG: pyridoxal phosphate-dependent aminotransferase [Candidatus Acidiferrales bacterium]